MEDFLSHVVRDQFEEAAPLLTQGSGGNRTPGTLRRWKESVEAGLGRIHRVRGETDWISGTEAEATGVLVTRQRERRLRFSLEREEGGWRIAQLDDFWGSAGPAGSTPAAIRIRENGRAQPRERNR